MAILAALAVTVAGVVAVELICRPGRARIVGEIERGETFEQAFGPGFVLRLRPTSCGWSVGVFHDSVKGDLSWITPPFRTVPNHRSIEGWHFRNADNTGPNEAGPLNVNAPGLLRRFYFALPGQPHPKRDDVLDLIDDPARVGSGRILLSDVGLGHLVPNGKAVIESLRFGVVLTWPRDLGFRSP